MTKYCANIVTDVSEYTIALFSDEVTVKAMAAFAEEQFELGIPCQLPVRRFTLKTLLREKFCTNVLCPRILKKC